jgi:galactokinase
LHALTASNPTMLKIPEFERTYGRPPRWIIAAPGLVNVIGEHTDYNDGLVWQMAIERYTVLAADISLSRAPRIYIHDSRVHDAAQIDLAKSVTKAVPSWSNHLRGVAAGFQGRGIRIPPLDVSLATTVPLGGGLSGSAALEVAIATLLEAVTGTKLDPVEKALLCQQAEDEFAGVPCGIMDQFVSVMGRPNHLLLLDCRSRQTQLVPMDDPAVALLLINTNVRHELSRGKYAERRAQCEEAARTLGVPALRDATPEDLERTRRKMDLPVYYRARHVICEIERTVQVAEEIQKSNWVGAGELMYASHYSLRDDYEVSCRELDAVVQIAGSIGLQSGVYGWRMTGAGFGGSCVALVRTDALDGITQKLAADYNARTGNEAVIFSSRPAGGRRCGKVRKCRLAGIEQANYG